MDSRLQQLEHWLRETLSSLLETPDLNSLSVAAVSGDASFRRYFRARLDEQSWIVMDAPPEKENCIPYISIAHFWYGKGIHVPRILASDLEQGFLLLSDFGDDLLLTCLQRTKKDAETADKLYRSCIDDLLRIQLSMNEEPRLPLPPYNAKLLNREMTLFSDWLCDRKLRQTLSTDVRLLLLSTFQQLAKAALAQPRVPVHRDYHSRNIMVVNLEAPSLGHLDFQDAVMGPITYDLVSLLRDCYIKWPEKQVNEWVSYYFTQATEQGLLHVDRAEFQRWFDWMGIQRHLKAAGIFARLSLRDGKHGYLADIPLTVGYIAEVSARYPELSTFHRWLTGHIQPLLEARLKAPVTRKVKK